MILMLSQEIICKRCKPEQKLKVFTFPYLMDDGQKIYPQYGATKTPHVYILEKTTKGNIVKYIGAIDDNYQDAAAVKTKYAENAIDALLAGKENSSKNYESNRLFNQSKVDIFTS